MSEARGESGPHGRGADGDCRRGHPRRIYLEPTPNMSLRIFERRRCRSGSTFAGRSAQFLHAFAYGLPNFKDLFTPRQLVALTTFSDLVSEARNKALADARNHWSGLTGRTNALSTKAAWGRLRTQTRSGDISWLSLSTCGPLRIVSFGWLLKENTMVSRSERRLQCLGISQKPTLWGNPVRESKPAGLRTISIVLIMPKCAYRPVFH